MRPLMSQEQLLTRHGLLIAVASSWEGALLSTTLGSNANKVKENERNAETLTSFDGVLKVLLAICLGFLLGEAPAGRLCPPTFGGRIIP